MALEKLENLDQLKFLLESQNEFALRSCKLDGQLPGGTYQYVRYIFVVDVEKGVDGSGAGTLTKSKRFQSFHYRIGYRQTARVELTPYKLVTLCNQVALLPDRKHPWLQYKFSRRFASIQVIDRGIKGDWVLVINSRL